MTYWYNRKKSAWEYNGGAKWVLRTSRDILVVRSALTFQWPATGSALAVPKDLRWDMIYL